MMTKHSTDPSLLQQIGNINNQHEQRIEITAGAAYVSTCTFSKNNQVSNASDVTISAGIMMQYGTVVVYLSTFYESKSFHLQCEIAIAFLPSRHLYLTR